MPSLFHKSFLALHKRHFVYKVLNRRKASEINTRSIQRSGNKKAHRLCADNYTNHDRKSGANALSALVQQKQNYQRSSNRIYTITKMTHFNKNSCRQGDCSEEKP